MGTTTTIRRNSNQQQKSFRNFMWISMLMSLAVVFFGMQLMMVGPLKGRLDSIQTRLDTSDRNIEKLVGVQDDVMNANNLLASLQTQANSVSEMQGSVQKIAALRSAVEQEATSADLALAAFDQIVSVQQRLVASHDQTTAAMGQVQQLEDLRERVVSGGNQTDIANNSLDGVMALQKRVIAAANGYEDASNSIANLTDLTQQLVNSSEKLQIASARFDDFLSLQNRMIAAADDFKQAEAGLELAEKSTNRLAALKAQILEAGEDAQTAETTARTLVAMNATLNGDGMQLQAAHDNLDQMMHLQKVLGDQTTRVATAIQNLELMDDFQNEVTSHVHTLGSLRRDLMEIAMMETTIGRVAQVIAPLSEISNLRRLSEKEVREAARVILQQRSTRVSRMPKAPRADQQLADDASAEEDLVPLPPEARSVQ